MNEYIYQGIIVVLAVVAIVAFVRAATYKIHDWHHKKAVDQLEAELAVERQKSSSTIEQLNEVAYRNPITKLGNIDYFKLKSEALFEKRPDDTYTLIVFNIANIGKINQLFGPTEGDNVILHAAEVLKDVGTQNWELFAQIYSNLFGLLAKGGTEENALRLVKEITEGLTKYNENIQIEATFGIYHKFDVKEPILKIVNACMLAQKFVTDPTECNYIFYTEELEAQFVENKKMNDEMVEALENHDFLMYLQPMVDLQNFRIVGAEALVRWDYPGKGLLSPYAFISVLEETKLIFRLDYYMWEECCRTLRRWIDNKITPTPISMNISPIHFQQPGLVEKLNSLCKHYLIDKKYLLLEFPERTFTGDLDKVKETITQLKENGFTLCVDSFGIANSPLSLFHDYPLDRIKLDRSFLNKTIDDEDGMSIMRYLVAMAKNSGKTVVAEGVETLEQVNQLQEFGCDLAQGYFFSKPVPPRQFDMLNRSMVNKVYQSDTYYPTFQDLERDLDLLSSMLESTES